MHLFVTCTESVSEIESVSWLASWRNQDPYSSSAESWGNTGTIKNNRTKKHMFLVHSTLIRIYTNVTTCVEWHNISCPQYATSVARHLRMEKTALSSFRCIPFLCYLICTRSHSIPRKIGWQKMKRSWKWTNMLHPKTSKCVLPGLLNQQLDCHCAPTALVIKGAAGNIHIHTQQHTDHENIVQFLLLDIRW